MHGQIRCFETPARLRHGYRDVLSVLGSFPGARVVPAEREVKRAE